MLWFAWGVAGAATFDEADVRRRFFMPALEVGPAISTDEAVDPGVLFRSSVDYRFARINAPFLRATYDATTAGYRAPGLRANASFHDLVVGGGIRWGSQRFQVVGTLQAGLQIQELPKLVTHPTLVEVRSQVALRPLVTSGAGFEVYLFPGVAVTAEVSGRIPVWTNPSLAGAMTVGVSTSL